MGRVGTGFVAAVVEAWQELRIHKLRVLLSLVGVCIAVATLTATVAFADIGKQAYREGNEREGRPALLATYVSQGFDGMPASGPEVRSAFQSVAEEFEVTYTSVSSSTSFTASAGGAATRVEARVVDPDFAAMHRVVTTSGRWLTDADAENRSPAVVVEPRLLENLGLESAGLPTQVDLTTEDTGKKVTATVVGVTSSRAGYGEAPGLFMLYDAYTAQLGGGLGQNGDVTWEMWVPVEGAEQLAAEVGSAMRTELPGYSADTSRNDYLAWGGGDDLEIVTRVVAGISALILLLGGLSLLNVAVITIQQRVREIGVRRSFGATTGRVFFSVVMESIVATMVAGVVGVMLAVLVVNGPWTEEYVLSGIDDAPPFPVSAAFVGLGAALFVGAVAGVLPAVIASRVKIIDAIRF